MSDFIVTNSFEQIVEEMLVFFINRFIFTLTSNVIINFSFWCLSDKQAVYIQGSVHVQPRSRNVCHNTYITCYYLEQVPSQKRAIDTLDVNVNINLFIKNLVNVNYVFINNIRH
jgi:hypothetical protein